MEEEKMSEDESINETESEEHDEEDDSSSESVDEEIKLNQNFINTLQKIADSAANKNYDDYILLLDIAHDLKDLDKIRQSIEIFSKEFPLSPEIWLRYLHVEITVAQTEDELDELIKTFKRALNDYYSIDVALEYAKLASRVSESKAKEIWEEILPAYGYEFTKGRLVWQAWREFFVKNEADSPEKVRRIVKRFKEELLLPLSEMQKTYVEFREYLDKYGDQLPKKFDREAFEVEVKNTKKILQKVLPFEQRLSKLEGKSHHERVEIFKQYVYECADDLEEEYVQVLYERMITACCLNESVWKLYINFIQNRSSEWAPLETNKSKIFIQTDLDIVDRGLRNCSWSADLYVEKMRIFEQNKEPREKIQTILEEATQIQYNSAEPIVKVWIEYLTYLSRITNYTNDKEKEILRNNFNLAWNTLGWQYGNLADCDCEILKFWGRIEYSKLNDHNQGKQLWNTVMESNENYLKTSLWIEFSQLEHQFRGAEAARLIFKRAMKVHELNDLPSMVSYWIRFERCHGSLEHLKSCQEVCNKILLQHRKKYNSNKRKSDGGKKDSKDNKRKAEDDHPHQSQSKKIRDATTTVSKEEFQKLTISKQAHAQATENENGEEIDIAKDSLRIFLSNLDATITIEDLRELFPEINIVNFKMITRGKGKSGFGYAELSSEVDAKRALGFDRRLLAGRPVFISPCERDKSHRSHGFKYSTNIEPNKIFIKGLSFDATDSDLKKLFSEFGAIKDIRIVINKYGKSKGIAYVEFEEAKSASNAVFKMDQKDFMERTLTVAISEPPSHDKKPVPNSSNIPTQSGMHHQQQHNQRKTFAPRAEQKSRISFIPASVQKAAVASKDTIVQPPKQPAKSNDDFRKMLMK